MKPYMIAEIGVNFYDTAHAEGISPMEAAKKYIAAAKACGIHAVKFQSYKAETIVSKYSPAYWDLSKEPTKTQYELFKKHDSFGRDEYYELYLYAKNQGIDFLSTPFDYASADYLEEMVDRYKISSSDLSNYPFLKYVASKGKPVLLSVGASYLSEIDQAVRIISEAGCHDLTLLHCVLSYPCKFENANLNIIKTLSKIYPDLKIGYSDHTLPDPGMIVLTTACLLGATVIEKHFTLDKTLPGNDHYHAGDPEDFKRAISNIELLDQILGSGRKTVLECEKIPRREARRSLVVNKEINQGEIIRAEDIIAKRPGTGIGPEYSEIVAGRISKINLKEDTVLQWDMI